MQSRHVFFLIRMVLSPKWVFSPLKSFFALRMSRSTSATFFFDIAKTPPRFLARKDLPSPEIVEEIVITFL